jgi:thioredoxin-dependent peroxiredoxin
MVEIGDKLPDISLLNQDDVDVALKSYEGQWIVIYTYPKDSTPGCTTEACDFTQAMPRFDDIDAMVIGVSPDSTKSHRNFILKKELKVTLLSDPDKILLKALGSWGEKKNYGKVYDGVIRSTYIINPDGVVAFKWENLRVKGHVEKVHDKLIELQTVKRVF